MNDQPIEAQAKKSYLTRTLILAAQDLPTQEVEVPEWGGTVLIRAMTGLERDAFESTMLVESDKETRASKLHNLRARLCAQVIVEADGITPVFSAKDLELLGAKNAKALNRVFEAARALSGFTEKDVKELEGK